MATITPPAPTTTTTARPPVVVLCGSTRFEQEFRRVAAELTLDGAIVVKPDVFANDGHAAKAHLPTVSADVKQRLDALHLRKIDLADAVIVVNPGGYIGESTRREIAYAEQVGKPVTYLHPTEQHSDQAPAAPVHTTRLLVAATLAEHHAVTVHLGGGLYVWVCLCGAPGTPRETTTADGGGQPNRGASSHETAYSRALNHTAQAVLDALTRAGAL